MACCRCNRTGRCRGCACLNASRVCTNCLPGRLGSCHNQPPSLSDSTAPTTSLLASPPSLSLTNNQTSNQTAETDANSPISDVSSNSSTLEQSYSEHLPPHDPLPDPSFTWGSKDSDSLIADMNKAYDEIVHWKKNIFSVPQGNCGSDFVKEIAKLFSAYSQSSSLEGVVFKSIFVMCATLLQRPHARSKHRDHKSSLSRRLTLWKNGDIILLLEEGRTLQSRLKFNGKNTARDKQKDTMRRFANMMEEGKVKDALRSLSEEDKSSVLNVHDQITTPSNTNPRSVLDILKEKHPTAQSPWEEALHKSNPPPPDTHPVIFDSIDSVHVRRAAIRTFGAGGPSRTDAYCWRRMCSSFGRYSDELCHSIAAVAKRLCSSLVHPDGIRPLLACRLIALNKNPGVRPIGISEVPRRIIAKTILAVLKYDIMEAAGPLQLCAGQITGIEGAIHSMRSVFNDNNNTQGMLLVDATNAFNSLNRATAVKNIQNLCPSFFNIICNCYRSPSELFVDGTTILSEEGTTQGDPLAMPMYALATVPLIRQLSSHSVTQVWYADDASSAGGLVQVLSWWKHLTKVGPLFGYYPNSEKSWLVVKPEFYPEAMRLFKDTGVQITTEGRPLLGSPIGSQKYTESFINSKVKKWGTAIIKLSQIAKTYPQAAHSAFTHGIIGWWLFLCRTTPNIDLLLQPLEDVIHEKLIPAITGRESMTNLRELFSLPPRLGGLGIRNPTKSSSEYQQSLAVTSPLVQLIHAQEVSYNTDVLCNQILLKNETKIEKRHFISTHADSIRESLSADLLKAVTLASEKGASNWLSSLPLRQYGFSLHKTAFFDAIALRYGWSPKLLPSECVCGKALSVEHSLSCTRGGFPSLRHNEIRDFTAELLSEVCSNVCTEPTLNTISDEILPSSAITTDGARLDIAADGFWGSRNERTFFDVRVFNPLARSNSSDQITTVYRKHEREKKRGYEAKIREVEHGTFTPLVVSCSGGLGPEAGVFYKRLASLLSHKWNQPYSVTTSYIRCCLSYCLLRSSIRCIRGHRSTCGKPVRVRQTPLDLISSECDNN